jgi:acyl-CoA synthetase (AMP-forming)/AMP-acid ligase II
VRWLDVGELGRAVRSTVARSAADSPLAMLQYTSGSTGEPRGVMLTHANLLHNSSVIHRVSAHRAGDSGVFWLPPFHDMGLIGGIVQPVYAGCPSVLMAPATFLQRPMRWLEAMSRYRATTSGAPNFAYDLCVERTTEEERAALDLSAWRTSFNGAEPVRSDTIARFVEAFAASGLRRGVIVPCYGLAEATLIVSGGPAEQATEGLRVGRRALEQGRLAAPSVHEEGAVLVASGLPAEEHAVAIVDPEATTRLPDGRVGEIWVSSPSVARGYWGRTQETTATFGARLAGDERTWLRTGDLGALHDGALVVTGRLKDLVILQGRNYYPHDIEVAAERSHPDLRPGFSAAFCVGGDRREELVLALEVSRHHRAADDDALFHGVRAELADTVGVVPSEILLLRQNTIPRTSSGKIQRGACRAAFLDGTLEVIARWRAERAGRIDGAADPAPSINEFLLAWAREELEIDPAKLHADTPLLELGIDSLAATKLKDKSVIPALNDPL